MSFAFKYHKQYPNLLFIYEDSILWAIVIQYKNSDKEKINIFDLEVNISNWPFAKGPTLHLLADFFIVTLQSNGPSSGCAVVTSQWNDVKRTTCSTTCPEFGERAIQFVTRHFCVICHLWDFVFTICKHAWCIWWFFLKDNHTPITMSCNYDMYV